MIDALQNGIGMVVQESGTISGVTVAENIFLAELSQFRNKLGMINKKAMNQKATEAMRAIGVEHEPEICLLLHWIFRPESW